MSDGRVMIQRLWGGYGAVYRVKGDGTVVKYVEVPCSEFTSLSCRRKWSSYLNEAIFYKEVLPQFIDLDDPSALPLPWLVSVAGTEGYDNERDIVLCDEIRRLSLTMTDLGSRGYLACARGTDRNHVLAMVRWLAQFHATFLHDVKDSTYDVASKWSLLKKLWPQGSYWHLGTRMEEWEAIQVPKRGATPSMNALLKTTAVALDAALRQCRFQSVLHGDAKPANFLVRSPESSGTDVAACDFQYVGLGCGMIDFVYLAEYCCPSSKTGEAWIRELLSYYFDCMFKELARQQSPCAQHAALIQQEWTVMLDVAAADLQRFYCGWCGGVSADDITEPMLSMVRRGIQQCRGSGDK